MNSDVTYSQTVLPNLALPRLCGRPLPLLMSPNSSLHVVTLKK